MRRLLTLVLAASALFAVAQNPASEDNAPVATLKATTRFVLVDAVITDKQGHPVTDLDKTEVEVLENGKPQKISLMTLQHFSAGKAPSSLVTLPKPPNAFSNAPSTAATDQTPTIMLLDWLNTSFEDQVFAREQAAKYLRSQGAGQRLAIYLLTTEMQLLQDFTNDSDALQAALEKAAPRRVMKYPGQNYCRTTQLGLEEIAGHVGAFRGRKNLVWIAASFLDLHFVGADRESPRSECQKRMEATAKAVNGAHISIYTIDPEGVVSSSAQAAGLITANQIANETGGRSLHNWNDIAALINTAVEDGSNYYLFGYYPEDKDWDGKFRKIRVNVKRPDVEVRARKGYFATDTTTHIDVNSKEAKDSLGEALSWQESDWTQLPVEIEVAPARETVVHFAVDSDALNWERLPDGGRHGSFSFVVFAYNAKGKMVGSVQENADTRLRPTDNQPHATLPFEQKVKLAPGKYLIKAAVRDNRSGLIGTVTAPVEVPGS